MTSPSTSNEESPVPTTPTPPVIAPEATSVEAPSALDADSARASVRRRWLRRILGLLLVVVLLLVGSVGWLYWASQQVPDFYKSASIQSQPIAPERLKKTAARVTRQTREVLDRKPADEAVWNFEVTPEELNAWLVEELPGLVGGEWPDELSEPRVAFEKGRILVGVKVAASGWKGVASLSFRPTLRAPRTILLEVESLKVGNVPVPVERLVSEVPELENSPYLRRDRLSGQYVVRVPLETKETKDLQVETLDITSQRLRVSGR